MSTWAIILAAGSGTRLKKAGLSTRKQFIHHQGAPLYWHSAAALARAARVAGVVFVLPSDEYDQTKADAESILQDNPIGTAYRFTAGGERRQDSVYNGLLSLPSDCSRVLVHDSARPFATPKLVNRLLDALDDGNDAVIPTVAVKDTIKRTHGSVVAQTLPRSELAAVQTPQAFRLSSLIEAHKYCMEHDRAVTDDASMIEAMDRPVVVIPGEDDNQKITTPEDLKMLNAEQAPLPIPVTGWGYDVHKYGEGRPMVLGGVPIQGGPEVVAHSDGDVLLHALADAILGCLGRGDIGQHFPDTDAKFDNIESSILVNEVLQQADADGLTITHVDMTLICQKPKLAHWKKQIASAVSRLLKVAPNHVNLKATTEEGLGFTGKEKGIKAVVCVTGWMRE